MTNKDTTINRRILDVIDAIYDASIDPTHWQRALKSACALLEADAGQMGHFDHNNGQFNVSILFSDGDMHWNDTLQKKQEQHMAEDPRIKLCNQYPGKPISCRLYLTDEELHESQVYKDVLQFSRAEYSMLVVLKDAKNESFTGFGMFRPPEKEAFTQEECDLMGELVPHLKRAFAIQKRLGEALLYKHMATSALDHIPLGMFIVDAQCQIRFSNAMAQTFLKERDGFLDQPERLTLQSTQGNRALRSLVEKAVGKGEGSKSPVDSRTLAVSRKHGEGQLSILVSPLSDNSLPPGLDHLDIPLAVVFVTDPTQPQETPPELVQRLFGLTSREAELTAQLVMGRTLQETAAALDITDNTARSHLKAVFGKTNTSRQHDLVRLVMASPVWMRKTPAALDHDDALDALFEGSRRYLLYN
ncbi:MAG: helix-turn-helix transcriptional regulator [Magnetococcales bacterium]|nr:helix-turn-helix transcriptional regulator [Magnetococcales bacterium]